MIYPPILERERAHKLVGGGGTERERERKNLKQDSLLSAEPNAGPDLPKMMT